MMDMESLDYWLRVYVRRERIPQPPPFRVRLPVALLCLAIAFLLSCIERLAP